MVNEEPRFRPGLSRATNGSGRTATRSSPRWGPRGDGARHRWV